MYTLFCLALYIQHISSWMQKIYGFMPNNPSFPVCFSRKSARSFWLQQTEDCSWWSSEVSGCLCSWWCAVTSGASLWLSTNFYLLMQLDHVSKLLPTASAHVSDIQLLQALWCFSHIFFSSLGDSSLISIWNCPIISAGRWLQLDFFFYIYTFLISHPKGRISSAKWASREKFKQLIKPDESINLH